MPLLISERRNFASIIARVVYGIVLEGKDDPYYKVGKFQMQEVADAIAPGRYLVDFLPIC